MSRVAKNYKQTNNPTEKLLLSRRRVDALKNAYLNEFGDITCLSEKSIRDVRDAVKQTISEIKKHLGETQYSYLKIGINQQTKKDRNAMLLTFRHD